ncbi:MAG: SsrA-binding protein SmpB [Oenococcus sp.]|uniref:SsrA-binding protein SmpB n=1 Tax=Oenococcus TaxID=46254 RepID=UPI0021E9A0C3|nr:SsrA-binding protein SmpB [Oenococcus kitaharae]MCV3296646.1 SsrA-binding protein SmpB [Oenococcus kitaharae]
MAKKQKKDQALANNRRASFNYLVGETYEAGIQLTGTEIKSVRLGQITIGDAYVTIRNGQAYLNNANISPYKQGNQFNSDPLRRRKLLLHKREIAALDEAVMQGGKTIVPLRVYLVKGFAKILIAIGTGKKNYDKRQTIKERDMQRELGKNLKNYH